MGTGTESWPLGSVTLQTDGTFPQTGFLIQNDVPAGTYTLSAVLDGQPLASVPITILAAGTKMQGSLQIMEPGVVSVGGGTLAPLVMPGSILPLQGMYFEPGQVKLFADSATGQSLGSATADSTGTFTTNIVWPLADLQPNGAPTTSSPKRTARTLMPRCSYQAPQ
jgi:hypothetical protein